MALDFSRMLLQLSPAKSLDFGGGNGLARQQLALQREQFEETKKQHLQQMEWQKTEEAGRMARERMQAEREAAAAEATKQAALLAQQQQALQKFGELGGTGKTQQMAAMVPYLNQLGYDANSLGDVGGLPVYQLQNRAQEAERARGALPPPGEGETAEQSLMRLQSGDVGYPTDERGTLDDPSASRGPTLTDGQVSFNPGGETDEATADALNPGEADLATAQEFSGGDGSADVTVGRGMVPASLSTGDAYAQALAASQYASESGQPRRGPDEEDYQGAVPRNVIDLPAMQAETMARLNPALKASAASLPTEELRKSATDIGQAVGGLGFEASDALGAYDKALSPAVDIYKNQQALDAKKETRNDFTAKDISVEGEKGRDSAETLATKNKIPEAVTGLELADQINDMLTDPLGGNDTMIGGALIQMQAVKGDPSDRELKSAFGAEKIGLMDELINFIQEKARTGFSDQQKEAIKSYVARTSERLQAKVYGYLDDSTKLGPSYNQYTRQGFRDRVEQLVPTQWRKQWEEDRAAERKKNGGKADDSGPSGQTGGDIGAELDKQAKAAGLDAAAIRPLVATESGGNPKEKNHMGSSASGLFQFTDETAKRYGLKDAAEYANLPPDKQIEIGLRRFKDLGLDDKSTADDYAMANAAPGYINAKPGTVIAEYKSDTAFGKDVRAKNPGWIPADGGEITNDSIRAFYRRSRKGTDEKAAADLPEPKTAAEKRIQELRAKAGG